MATVTSIVTSGIGIDASGNGTLTMGAVVTLTVIFDDDVFVDATDGTPMLLLNNGASATYISGSGSNALTFSYTVGPLQDTFDLMVLLLDLNGATITDTFGNPAVLSGATVNPAGMLTINATLPPPPPPPTDTTSPTVTSIVTSGFGIDASGNGSLSTGAIITLTVTFDEIVLVNIIGGTPTLTLDNGATAVYSGGAGSNALAFSYTVGTGQVTDDLGVSSLNLNGATITDTFGNPAVLSGANVNPAGTLEITSDTTPPTVTSIVASGTGIDLSGNGSLSTGAVMTLTVNFSESVTVAGTPALSLSNGATATYAGGSGSNALAFSYTVGTGQDTDDLGVSSLNLNGATIADIAGNPADLSGATNVDPAGTLAITTDTTPPTVTSIVTSGTGIDLSGNGSLSTGAVMTLTVNFSESVTLAGTPVLSLNNGATATYAGGSGSNALTFSYTIGTEQDTADLGVASLDLNGATITDPAGNPADLSGATNVDPAGTLQITTDTTTPMVTSIVASGAGITDGTGLLNVGDIVTLTVNFTETVLVNTTAGTPTLSLNNGPGAVYTSGSGSSSLTFFYRVGEQQNAADLIVSSLNLNGATIMDPAGHSADLSGATGFEPAGTLTIDTTMPPPIELVSADAFGVTTGGGFYSFISPEISNSHMISADGRYISFNLGAVKDMQTGALTAAGWDSISNDGRYVVFTSGASLTPEDTDAKSDVYARDMQTGEITLVSTDAAYTSNLLSRVSADGRYVLFLSTPEPFGPLDGPFDVRVKDMETGSITHLYSGVLLTGLALSADGRYAVFQTADPFGNPYLAYVVLEVATGTIIRSVPSRYSSIGGTASLSADGQYLAFDGRDGVLLDVLTGEYITPPSFSASMLSISADGRYVAFASDDANLVPGDTNQAADVFVWDRTTGAVARVSTSVDGEEASAGNWAPWISADGRYITFQSEAENLVPGSEFGVFNVFRAVNPFAVDMSGPVVSSIVASGSGIDGLGNGSLTTGALITLTVTFSENVTVTGSPALSLNNGASALFSGGSGSNALAFSYTVEAGQDTPDLAVTTLDLNGATITDATGNTVDLSGVVDFNPPGTLGIDTTPTPPTITLAADTGLSASDKITQVSTLTGAAAPGATVTLTEGTTVLGTATADPTGTWTFVPTLADGTHTITVTSAGTASLTFSLDTVLEVAPTIGLANDTGLSGDNLTSDPTLTGTTEPGGAAAIYDLTGLVLGIPNSEPILLATVTADPSGTWSYTPTLSDGPHAFVVAAGDVAGNGNLSNLFGMVLESTPPTITLAADTGLSASDKITQVSTLTGAAAPGATVTLTEGTTVLGTATADPTGTWTFVPTLADGTHTITVTSAGTASLTFSLDTVLEVAPTIGLANDTGLSGDNLTSDPTLTGTTEPGGAAAIYDLTGLVLGIPNSEPILLATVTADPSGTWSYTPTLSDGPHVFQVAAGDVAGNGNLSNLFGMVLESTPPTITLAADTGLSASDKITQVSTLTGAAAPGATVTLTEGTTVLGTATADPTGTWTFVPTLADGTHTITVTSAGTASLTFSLDTVLEVAPTIGLANDTGLSGDNLTSDPTLTGTTEPGGAAAIYDLTGLVLGIPNSEPILLATVTADPSGTWSYTPTLSDGPHAFVVAAGDVAGNGNLSNLFGMVLESTPPTITLAADTGLSASDKITQVSTLTGAAAPGATVTLTEGTTVLGTATADPTGTWTFVPTLADGTHTITVTSAGTASLTFSLDTVLEVAPTIGLANDTGLSGDNLTSDPTLTGTTEPGGAAAIYDLTGLVLGIPNSEPILLATVTADPSGTWSYTPTLSDGPHAFVVAAGDVAGNGNLSNLFGMVLESTPPTITLAADTGLSASDKITQVSTLTGAAAPGATVTLTEGTTVLGTATADPTGTWTFVPTLADGTHTITVTSAGTASLTFSLDTVLEVAPTIGLANDTGLSGDNLTSDPTLTGTTEPGGAAAIYDLTGLVLGIPNSEPILLATVTADPSGTWSYTPTLSDGPHVFQVAAGDVAGNSNVTNIFGMVLDTAPPALTLALANDAGWYSDDGVTNVGLINVSGLEAGTGWEYSTDGGQSWVAGSGSSLSLTVDGSYSVLARQTDTAGNSGTSAALAITLDTTMATPTIALVNDTGSSTSDGITSDASVIVTADAGTLVSIYDGSTLRVQFTAPWPGAFELGNFVSDGPHSFTVRSNDAAGNTATSAPLTVTFDRTIALTLALANDAGWYSDDGVTNVGLINVSGLEAGTGWEYSTDGGQSWVAGSGSSLSLTVDGSYSVLARQTDTAGNSGTSAALAITLDTTMATPTIALVNDTGSSTSDGITSDASVIVTADAGTLVSIYDGSTLRVQFTAPWPGAFELGNFVSDGPHSFTVRSNDAAGNTATSAPLTVTFDRTIALTLALANDAGWYSDDGVTNVGLINVSGLEAGTGWEYSTDGGQSWVAGSGSSLSLTVDGSYSVLARQTDTAGNSGTSAALAITLDTTMATPTIALVNDTGSSTSDGITSDASVIVTADAGTLVSIYDGSTLRVQFTAPWPGAFELGNFVSDGPHSFTVRSNDAAGNTATSAALAMTLDTSMPMVSSVITSGSGIDAGGNGILNTGAVVTLTVSFNEPVTATGSPTLSLNNGATATYTGGSGSNALTFSYTVGAGQSTADLSVASLILNGATITDAAGNSAELSGATNFNPAGTLQISGATIIGTSGSDNLNGTSGSDVIDAGSGDDLVNAGGGNDTVSGGAGGDVVLAGSGNDTIVATIGDGSDVYLGDSGSDTYDLSQITAPVTVSLGTTIAGITLNGIGSASGSQIGSDTLLSIENAIGGSGNDTITGDNNANVLSGSVGNDTISGRGGNDTLNGGAGADTLVGGAGADVLIGGFGNDTLTGEVGNDTFVFAAGFGNDTISGFDFNPAGGQDLLDISSFGITSATFASRVGLTNLGADILVTIDSDASQTIALVNAQLVSNITQSDFILSL